MSNTEHFSLLIAGRSTAKSSPIEVTSPFDDQLIATVDSSDLDDIDYALNTASTLFTDRDSWLPISQRITIIERAILMMEQQAEELAIGAAQEGGKPLLDSRIEMARCIDSFRTCVGRAEVTISKSFGVRLTNRSRTLPPTR